LNLNNSKHSEGRKRGPKTLHPKTKGEQNRSSYLKRRALVVQAKEIQEMRGSKLVRRIPKTAGQKREAKPEFLVLEAPCIVLSPKEEVHVWLFKDMIPPNILSQLLTSTLLLKTITPPGNGGTKRNGQPTFFFSFLLIIN